MELQLHLASLRYIFILGLTGGAPNCESRSSAFQHEKYSMGLCLGLLRRVGSDVVFHSPVGRLSYLQTCFAITLNMDWRFPGNTSVRGT